VSGAEQPDGLGVKRVIPPNQRFDHSVRDDCVLPNEVREDRTAVSSPIESKWKELNVSQQRLVVLAQAKSGHDCEVESIKPVRE
jgi:hypothetical protein